MFLSNKQTWGETLTQVVAVEANTDYTLTYWAKRVSGNTPWDLFVYNKDTMTVLSLTDGNNWITAGTLWTRQTVSFHSGDAVNLFLKFCPENNSGGTLLVDDVVLTKKSGSTPDTPDQPDTPSGPVFENGGFEAGLAGWQAGGDTALDASAPHGGQNAVLLSHPSAWGEALTRTAAVEANTDYTLTFWYKRVSGNGAWNVFVYDGGVSKVLPYTAGENWFGSAGTAWVQHTVRFNSGTNTSVFLKFCPESDTSGTFLLDDVALTKGGEEPDVPTPPTPPAGEKTLSLTSFSTVRNRPDSDRANLLTGGGFESAKGAAWNVDTFLSDRVTVVKDPTAIEGDKVLYFNTSGTTEEEAEWHVFWLDVQPDTEYVFSAWVKGAFLSADNAGRATVGVIDPDTQRFLVDKSQKFSTALRQIVPPAWDTQWHLRSVTFHSGSKTRIGVALYGYGSQLWLDDLALFAADSGKQYTSPQVSSTVSIHYNVDATVCKDEDSLTDNLRMDDASSDFWQTGTGWRNGFLSFAENQYEYGTSLKYTANEETDGVYYIKWLEVKPHTKYVFSVDAKILKDGYGRLVLMDGKKRGTLVFASLDFDTTSYGEDWFRYAVGFDTDVFTTIGIGVVNSGGGALLDNIRLFEAEDGIGTKDIYLTKPTTAASVKATAPSGQKASVTVKATGEKLKYTWYYKNKGDTRFTKTTAFTGATYSVVMNSARDGRQVYCVVSDRNGYQVTTPVTTLHMGNPVKITAQPKIGYAREGAAAKTAVKATGDGLKYAWYIKNAGASKYVKSSVTKATYSAVMSDKVHGRRVYCVVTDRYGNAWKTDTVLLRRQATVTSQPAANVVASRNTTARIALKAKGDGLTYAWYIKNAGGSKFSRSSVTGATYSCRLTSASRNRQVYCMVKDRYGNTARTKTFVLRLGVGVVTQPKSVTVKSGKTARVTVKGEGDGLTYRWYVKNAGATGYTRSSVTSSTYSCKMSAKVDGRRLICYIYDKYGNRVQTKTVVLKKK